MIMYSDTSDGYENAAINPVVNIYIYIYTY